MPQLLTPVFEVYGIFALREISVRKSAVGQRTLVLICQDHHFMQLISSINKVCLITLSLLIVLILICQDPRLVVSTTSTSRNTEGASRDSLGHVTGGGAWTRRAGRR